MASGIEIERLYSTVTVDLSELRTGLASAQTETRAATVGMSAAFDQASTKVVAANNRMLNSAKASAQGYRQAGVQLGDFGSSIAMGIPLQMAFIQQIGQMGFALQQTNGKLQGLGGFLAGPYGAALTLVIALGGALITSLLEQADASEEAKKAAEEQAEAEKRLANATAVANHQTRQGVLDDIARANSLRTRRIETLETLKAELMLAKQRSADAAKDAVGGRAANYGAMYQAQNAERSVTSIEGEIAKTEILIKKTNGAINAGLRKIAERDVTAATDPRAAAEQRYEDASDKFARELDAGKMTISAYRNKLIAETNLRDQTIKALQDMAKDERNSNSARRKAEAEARRLARERTAAENKEFRIDTAYRRQVATAQSGLIAAHIAVSMSLEERAKFELEAITIRSKQTDEEIAANRDYNDAQKGRLLAINEETLALQKRKLELDKEQEQMRRDISDIQNAADLDDIKKSTELELLHQQQGLARTSAARQEIALKIVEMEHQLAEARQQEIIASSMRVIASDAATEAEKLAARAAIERANASIDGLNATLPGKLEDAKRGNANVLEPGEFARRFGDTLEAGLLAGLQSKSLKGALRDGIVKLGEDAMSEAFNTLSTVLFGKDGVGGFLRDLISGQQSGNGGLLSALLSGSGQGGGGGGGEGGFFASLATAAASIFGGARAVGGPTVAGRAYDIGVGEKWVAPANGRILSRADAMAAAGGSKPGRLDIHVHGARGNAEIMEMVSAGVSSGLKQYDQVVGDRVTENNMRYGQ